MADSGAVFVDRWGDSLFSPFNGRKWYNMYFWRETTEKSNPESFAYHSILGAGCQLVEGNGNPLSCWNRWSVATWGRRNIRTNESTQHLKRRPCHSKMLHPETFCKVSLHNFLPERLIAWSLPDAWASSHNKGSFRALSDEQLLHSAVVFWYFGHLQLFV